MDVYGRKGMYGESSYIKCKITLYYCFIIIRTFTCSRLSSLSQTGCVEGSIRGDLEGVCRMK